MAICRNIGQRLVDADADTDAAEPGTVERGDSGCAAVRLHAMDEHGPALPAQLRDQTHGQQHEVEIVVDAGLVDQPHINLFGAGR